MEAENLNILKPLEIIFLGTGTSHGVPQIACSCEVCTSTDSKDNRLRSSIFIKYGSTNIIIDTGPDFRQQMLREKITHLEHIIYTHEHKDHIAGLDDIRSFSFNEGHEIPIYATNWVQENIKQSFAYIFAQNRYPGIPLVRLNTISKENTFFIDDLEIIPIEVIHFKLPVLGYRLRNFTYITDANYISDNEIEKIKGTDILILNCLRIEPHLSHFNLSSALEMIKKINPKQAYLTHISHQLGKHNEVLKLLPKNVSLAYDGLKFFV